MRDKKLTPEEKVNLTIRMTDAALQTLEDSIRKRNPGITEAELMEKVRRRLMRQRRH